jgi:hypothetical protein
MELMTPECSICDELRLAVDRAERFRLAARARFEAYTSVAAAAVAAEEYREAGDAFHQAIANLAAHRNSHDARS